MQISRPQLPEILIQAVSVPRVHILKAFLGGSKTSWFGIHVSKARKHHPRSQGRIPTVSQIAELCAVDSSIQHG